MLHADRRRRVTAALCAAAVVGACGVQLDASAPAAHAVSVTAALDVPYMPQSQDLCGGAAVAMVLRYWGERGITPEEFAPLVRADAAGIPTGVLTDAVTRRGWLAHPFTGTHEIVRHHLSRGRPVIALIAIRPGRYHYVVVLAWPDGEVLVHDPAIAPARRLRARDFDAAWAATGRWSLLVLPDRGGVRSRSGPPERPGAERADTPPAPLPPPCADALARGVRDAGDNDLDAARAALEEGRRLCPAASAPLRELAGVALLQRRPDEAADLASRAVGLDPADAHAWRVLATSRFLLRDRRGALSAWNQVAEPRVDLVQIDGLARTRFRVVSDRIDVAPGRLLTPDALLHAERRIASLPTVRAARVGYRPVAGGLAEVDAAVVERPLAPRAWPQVAAAGVRALVGREVTYAVASPLGAGELWHASWRFWESRPAVAGGVTLPLAAGPVRGVASLTGRWEEQSYASGPSGDPAVVRESHRAARATLSDWLSPHLRWEAAAGVDRWGDAATFAVTGATLDARLAGERGTAVATVHQWIGTTRFTAATLAAGWRSTVEPQQPSWGGTATLALATAAAPRGLWEGAGTGHGRTLLLRAHPLLDRGVIDGAVFGRRVAHVTVERRHPIASAGPIGVSLAGFVDAARHWDGLRPGLAQIDAGLGVRLRLPGEGTLRVDVARGLRSGGTVLSVGWIP